MTKEQLLTNFHRNVRQIAAERGMPLRDLEAKMEVPHLYLSGSKSRMTNIPFWIAYKAAKCLGVPISDLIMDEQYKEKERLRKQYMEIRKELDRLGDKDFLRMI